MGRYANPSFPNPYELPLSHMSCRNISYVFLELDNLSTLLCSPTIG